MIHHHNDLSPDLKSFVPFQREVNQAIGYFPVINMIVNVCIIIAINKTITIIINKTITINMIVNVCVITAINNTITILPADYCNRYFVFITTTAHRHLVLDKKFNLAHLALAYI